MNGLVKLATLILPNLGQIKAFFSKPFDKNNFIALCVIFAFAAVGTAYDPAYMLKLIDIFSMLAEAFNEAS